MDYIEQIKKEGFTSITVEDQFEDEQFAQIKFRDNMNCSYVACFKDGKLTMIV